MILLVALVLSISPSFAQAPDHTSENFTLNQSSTALTLNQKEYETIYRTDQVPSTCYRSETHGTTTECHTEYDQSCHTDYQQECHDESYPVCQTVPRSECSTESVCETVDDSVCNSQGCTTVPRRVCHNEDSCHTVDDSVCHTESRNECQSVPHETCQSIPRQACEDVPNVVQVAYACTVPVQTPIGQRLKLETTAQVAVTLANLTETGPIAEAFSATLSNGTVSVKLVNASQKYLYQVASQTRTEQTTSATAKTVNYAFTLKATSIQKLNAFQSLQITNPKLFFDRLEFALSGGISVPFKGHLKLLQKRFLIGPKLILDEDFKASDIAVQGSSSVLSFTTFGLTRLGSNNLHYITLDLGLDLDALRVNLLNPAAISLIQNQGAPVESQTNAYPAN